MDEYWRVALLGAVQGLTEFLPISSDGHLVVASELLGLESSLGLTILLHMGTLAAILVVFWRPMIELLFADRRVIPLIIVGTLPAVVAGLLLKKFAEPWLTDPVLTGCMLPLTGAALLWGATAPAGEKDYQEMGFGRAFLIGLFQAAAILPGISRSGMTISSALRLGLRREDAATFSFLLGAPAIAGAGLLDFLEASPAERVALWTAPNLVGVAVSFVVGLAALVWLLRWLRQGRIHLFAYWVIPLGVAFTLWMLSRG